MRHPRPAVSFRMIGALAVTAIAVTGCSSGGGEDSGSSPRAGDVLSSAPLANAAVLPSAARSELITYASQNGAGEPIVVSGTVAIPSGTAPDGGWPVLSWAHGTTGIADTCAPSGDTVDGAVHDYVGMVSATLDQWVENGYVVVQTDYEGMGTPGDHTYLNATSESNAVTDIVRAARHLDPSVGDRWFVGGHSQGGAAAISASDQAVDRAPELTLLGAIAVAPGSGLSQTPQYVASGSQAVAPVLSFLPITLLGAAAADPAVVPAEIVTPAAEPLMRAARTGCIADVRAAIGDIQVNSVIRPGADLGPWTDYLAEQEPSNADPKVPVLFAQGTADALVTPAASQVLVKQLCEKGAELDYRTYDGADHRAAVAASRSDAQEFTDALLAGDETRQTC
ncbi:Serine aminopeptidase, S33 [Rhodococcus maanshanensis]|uniref:Serine aminopeptidase, S33 n=2 Tax=Rhodococcus maanshanensis TaxID=183556 RepID=A0A1H7WIC1_9NOCA|nr:Serine aminopeptidase, S33 [Rhodococcus maanshanensis]